MTPPVREPVAILGGGCAGLSLATALADAGAPVTVLEPRTRYADDRTWSFWDFGDSPWATHARHRWPRFLVRGAGTEALVECARTPYACLRAATFYERTLDRLTARPNAALEQGRTVESIEEHPDHVAIAVRTEGGETETRSFAFAFDARPPERPVGTAREPVLIQHFAGREIVFDRPVLDPDCATLMDFDVDQRDGLHFMYVLPFAEDRALFESTFLTPPRGPTPDYTAHIDAYCDRRFPGARREVVACEHGALPMTAAPLGPEPTPRVWPVGTRAGVGRASTGYAFDAIQRDTARVVRARAAGAARPAPPRPRLLRTLDRMLLSLLGDRPALGPALLAGLFARAPADSILRFLCDRPRAADALRVAWAMPKAPMLAHALARPALWRP